ncbi:MAG: hypothetical protein OEZ48_01505 [Candidatus Bathyarchaeota archaeon]|nr:hypothetical protein [Candidatus Bathyarchaeota archaeon]
MEADKRPQDASRETAAAQVLFHSADLVFVEMRMAEDLVPPVEVLAEAAESLRDAEYPALLLMLFVPFLEMSFLFDFAPHLVGGQHEEIIVIERIGFLDEDDIDPIEQVQETLRHHDAPVGPCDRYGFDLDGHLSLRTVFRLDLAYPVSREIRAFDRHAGFAELKQLVLYEQFRRLTSPSFRHLVQRQQFLDLHLEVFYLLPFTHFSSVTP